MIFAPPPEPAPAAIIVTGQALPEAKADSAYDVQRIDRRKIEASPTRQLDQLLKDVPGVQLFRRSDSHSGHPTSQGVTLRALGGNASSRALLMLDGVPQTDPFGGWINWPAYDLSDLQQIRVVRGGGSVANGPGSLAGTIEMISRTDAGTSGELDIGSRDSLDGRFRTAVEAGDELITLAGHSESGDGFVPVTAATRGPADKAAPYRNWSLRGGWSAPVTHNVSLQASVDGFHDWRNRGTDFTQNRTNGADASLKLVGRGAWQWSALGYWQWRNLMSSFASVSPGRGAATQVSLQDSVPSHGIGGSIEVRPPMPRGIELRLGADARRTDGGIARALQFRCGRPDAAAEGRGQHGDRGAVRRSDGGPRRTDSDGRRADRPLAGCRRPSSRMAVGDGGGDPRRSGCEARRLAADRAGRRGACGGQRVQPAVRSLPRLAHANLERAVSPVSRRRGCDGGQPEPAAGAPGRRRRRRAVQSPRSALVGDGLHQPTDRRHRQRDARRGTGTFPGVGFVGAGGTYGQRQNIGAVEVRGIDTSADWTHGPWSLGAGLSLTHARVDDRGAAAQLDGLRPAETPAVAATISAGWQKGGRSFDIVVRRVGAQFDDDLNTVRLKGATTIDASAAWPLGRRMQLIARGENLTNALVEAGINADQSIERATPRTLWLGIRLR